MNKEDLIKYWTESHIITDDNVIEAFIKVPREDFVQKSDKKHAYSDIPLPIPAGQTISQPTTVMIMTEILSIKPGMKILEVGSGSGYQAAILSHLTGGEGKVITTEIIPELHEYSKKNLYNYKNVKCVLTDGSIGYRDEAPYDRIIVTAAAPSVGEKLKKQLLEEGIMIIPVENESGTGQEMIRITKDENEEITTKNFGDYLFVPMRGIDGYD